jgi:hypothetical protein
MIVAVVASPSEPTAPLTLTSERPGASTDEDDALEGSSGKVALAVALEPGGATGCASVKVKVGGAVVVAIIEGSDVGTSSQDAAVLHLHAGDGIVEQSKQVCSNEQVPDPILNGGIAPESLVLDNNTKVNMPKFSSSVGIVPVS